MIPSYRDPRYAASIRLEQLQERGRELGDQIPAEIRTIHARRSARSAAGTSAVLGFFLVALLTGWNFLVASSERDPDVHPTFVLASAVLATIVIYGVTYHRAKRRFDSLVLASFDTSEDALAQVARLESDGVRRAAARITSRGERSSLALPLAGLGLLGPLTIHLVVWLVLHIGDMDSTRWVRSFDWWIAATLFLVGIAHGVLAYQAWRFAGIAEQMPTRRLEVESPIGGWAALGWTVLGSLLPGLIALAIPPVIVFLTGALFVPYSFNAMHRRLVEERDILESA